MARYKITHQVRSFIIDNYGDIYDTYYFNNLKEARKFVRNFSLPHGMTWDYEFVMQKGNKTEGLVEESVSEDGNYYENGMKVPTSVKE